MRYGSCPPGKFSDLIITVLFSIYSPFSICEVDLGQRPLHRNRGEVTGGGAKMASTVSNDIFFSFSRFLFGSAFLLYPGEMICTLPQCIQSRFSPVDKDGGERPASRTAPAF